VRLLISESLLQSLFYEGELALRRERLA
jgi:hypothetical protein